MTPDALELLHQLVATPSISRDETAAADLLQSWLADHGLASSRLDGDNVVVRVEGAEPGPTLLLNSHLDTVPARDGWESDPWTPFVADGRLVGLGSGDAKASVAAMACAAVAIARAGLPRGTLLFAATVMEEVGHGGLEKIVGELGPIDAALVGEPTALDAAVAQSGLMVVEGTAHGRTAHAARARQGINALTIAARDILALHGLTLDRVHPFLGASSVNVTVLKGGDRHNVIPDRCDYTIDVRYTPSYTADELHAILDATTEATLNLRSTRLRPVETGVNSPIVAALRAARPELTLFGSPTMSDWVHLAGTDAIKIGPGNSERSHTPNESVAIADVLAAVHLYRQAASTFLAG